MGASLVARVEAVGADAFQLVADRLLRDHQAPPRERWLAVIRSFRQPVPPIEHSPKLPDRQEDAPHAGNRAKKQRTMYCLRHSGRPGQLVAMIEDADAPSRLPLHAPAQHPHLSYPSDTTNHKKTGEPETQTHEKPADDTPHKSENPLLINDNEIEADKAPAVVNSDKKSTDMMVDDDIADMKTHEAATPTPRHFRVSIVSVPDSFEQLLSSAICATQSTLVPSAWCPRPNIVAIEGMSWGVYSSTFESEIGPLSHMGSIPSSLPTKETQPDWWIRLGTVTNKGATSGNTSLPWLILELECAASPIELDHSTEFLESVMQVLLKPDEKLLIKPFRPTEQNLLEAGLTPNEQGTHHRTTPPHPPKTACLRNGYCMLMLAKQESLI